MRTERVAVMVALISGMAFPGSSKGVVMIELHQSGTSAGSALVAPGAMLSLDVVATSITAEAGVLGELDAFTYRISFPNEEFTLINNAFSAPFDNTQAPSGYNGSIPWGGPLSIGNNADAGSPGATPLAADLYRTTATETGTPVSGPEVVLETLTLTVPNPPANTLPVNYSVSVNLLEAVDAFGAFHMTENGPDFLVTVVPEPESVALLAAAALLGYTVLRRRGGRLARTA